MGEVLWEGSVDGREWTKCSTTSRNKGTTLLHTLSTSKTALILASRNLQWM